jgi:hypothetical protein
MLLNFFLPMIKTEEEKMEMGSEETIAALKTEEEKSPEKKYPSYINEKMSSFEKIEFEKRRRNQVYLALDYLLSALTYFDFFSFDAFQTVKYSKSLAEIFETKVVNTEFLLIAFLYKNTQILEVAQEYGITKEIVSRLLSEEAENILKRKNNFFYSNFVDKIKNIFRPSTEEVEIPYSYELSVIFEKAAENALERFKTPVITSEILFLTLLESEESSKVRKLTRLVGMSELDFYLLKYKLIKRIHSQESAIREKVIKNQHYFAYLLKTQLPGDQFETLLKTELLATGVSLFRNILVSQVLQIDMFEVLKDDIHKSIKLTNKRKYSK